MNAPLILATLRQRFSSPVRMGLLALLGLTPLGAVALMPQNGLASLGDSYGLTLVLAAGLIGQDLSSGVLQLLFARPVRRSEYLIQRWLAVSLAVTALVLLQALLATGILEARQHPIGAREFATFVGNGAIIAFGTTAVLALFSSLLPGFGDLALLLVFQLTGGVLQMLGQVASRPVITRVGSEMTGFITPRFDLTPFLGGAEPSWFAIAAYCSTLTLSLALAIVVLNRRELSYASAG
jgi:ABC-type transport system involved in multi-copper enzyme maturation permease subunit